MINFLRRAINKGLFFYFILGVFLFLNGCASYKAEPLEDFTENKVSHLDSQKSNELDKQCQKH